MRLLVITPEINVVHETRTVNTLFRLGLDRLHLRKPLFATADYREYISDIHTAFHSRIVVHSSYELYTEMGLGGIHLNTAARTNPEIWNTLQHIPPGAISTSFHTWSEVADSDFPYGYVFISPVFNSISKPGYKGSIDIAAIAHVRARLSSANKYCPAITGLGGVDKNTIPLLQRHGFDGAAILGAVWNQADPVAAFEEIRAMIESEQIRMSSGSD